VVAALLEGENTRPQRIGQQQHAIFGQDTVWAAQGHHIGQGAQGHQIEQAADVGGLPGQQAVDGRGQEKGHAHPGQIGTRSRGQLGIDHGVGRRQRVPGQVVVGDDDGEPKLPGPGHLGRSADAAIHGDQDLCPVPGQGLDTGQVQAIAFRGAFGQPPQGGKSPLPQKIHQQGGTGDTVHVVVAPHGHGFPCGQGLGQ
jgi:hypothetical protein